VKDCSSDRASDKADTSLSISSAVLPSAILTVTRELGFVSELRFLRNFTGASNCLDWANPVNVAKFGMDGVQAMAATNAPLIGGDVFG
jgi:ACR3 family arsenite efflux pump ArsB